MDGPTAFIAKTRNGIDGSRVVLEVRGPLTCFLDGMEQGLVCSESTDSLSQNECFCPQNRDFGVILLTKFAV